MEERISIKVINADYETGKVEYIETWREFNFSNGRTIKKSEQKCEDEIEDLQACLNLNFCDTDIYDTKKKQIRWWNKVFVKDRLWGYYDTLT